jgi:hypothetical protein
MTFKFQAKEEQCYLVQDEESRGWRKPQPQYKKEKVAPTKPKLDRLITTMRKHWEQDKSFNGHHQPKKAKAINKAKGGRRRKSRTPPPKPHQLQRHRRKQRRCGVSREYRLSLPLRDRTNPRSIEETEESRSWTLNYEPSLRGKPIFISYFPFNLLFHASSIFSFQISFHHCISK